MSLARRSSPFGELLSLRQAMDRLFEDSYVRPGGGYSGAEEQPLPLDVLATDDALIVRAALPGVKPDDVEITLTGDMLAITGEFRDEREQKGEQYLFQELRRGRFTRSVSLPSDLDRDGATASFENGLLTLRIPKAAETRPRQIRITPTTSSTSDAPKGRDVTPETTAGSASGRGTQDSQPGQG